MEYDPEVDLRALEAMASNLTPYLYEETLYGTIAPNLPKLTVGALLYRLHRLQGIEAHLNDEQRTRLKDAKINFEQLRSEWMVHYEKKIEQEIGARLRSFRAFLDDYGDDANKGQAGYPAAATERTILHDLKREAQDLNLWTSDFEAELRKQDGRLRTVMGGENGKFIWADHLQPSYPSDEFWWLYGSPKDA